MTPGDDWRAAWDERLQQELGRGPDPGRVLALSRELERGAAREERVDDARRRERLDRARALAALALARATWRALAWLASLLTLLLPLIFVATWYGMNFRTHASPWSMPELVAWWGYPLVLAGAALLLLLGLALLRRARWRRLHDDG